MSEEADYDIQFVSAVSDTATVRLDLRDAPWSLQADTDFGTPALKRASVSTLMVDGERYPAAAFENRVITLVARINDVDDDTAAGVLQQLYRELDRPCNVLRYRPATSKPVFFRTFRAGPGQVRWNPVLREVTAVIPAEPFAVGLRVDLPARVMLNDPAAALGGLYFDVQPGEVQGDVETPLYMKVLATDVTPTPAGWSSGYGRRQTVLAVRRGGDPAQAPFVLQAESMIRPSDTLLRPNDLAMSGPGQNHVRVPFSFPGYDQRLLIHDFPPTPGPDVRGTYRVFVRLRKTVADDVVQMQLNCGLDSSGILTDPVTLPFGTQIRWVDLGRVQFPLGFDPVHDGLSGVELSVRGISVGLFVERLSGSGALDIDCFAFTPADDRWCAIRWPEFGSPDFYVVDGGQNQVYAIGSAGEVRATVTDVEGLTPMLSPNVINRITFIRDVGYDTDGGDDINGQVGVYPYYWPRYLSARGAS